MDTPLHHPIFARVYHWTSAKAETAGQAQHRRELLAGLHGRVLELGAGNPVMAPASTRALGTARRPEEAL